MARKHEERRADRRARKTTQAIEALTARVTCSTELTSSLAALCDRRTDRTLLEMGHPMFALEVWKARTSEIARRIVELAGELTTELERHRRAIAVLRDRFVDLNQREIHEHLEPAVETAVRQRLTSAVEMQAAVVPEGPFAIGVRRTPPPLA